VVVGSIDNATWQALGLVLTLVGLGVSAMMWRQRGAASGIRGAAWSLLPVAAGMTGTLRLVWEIGDSVVTWATRLVFSPVVWLGIVVAGVSAVLFVVASGMEKRGLGTKGRGPKQPDEAKQPKRVKGSADPALTASSGRPAAKAQPDEDLDDIEAILRKHGIS
jgi:hypothetical protein